MATTRTYHGTLTTADHKGHVPVAFDVPAGTTSVAGRFTTAPTRAAGALFDHMVCLTVLAPDGGRGGRHNNPDRDFVIAIDRATPGYTAGPITPGRWQVVLDGFRVLGPIDWSLEITLDDAPRPPLSAAPTVTAPTGGPGWYRGDLHAHSFHSDGSWTLEGLIGFARANRLDFVSLTDHNTVAGREAFLALAEPDLLTLAGVELTTHYGHFLVHGVSRWQEWRANSLPGVTMPALAADIARQGGFGIIAHPRAPGDPACTGCRWEYADMMPGPARLVEVWNGPWSEANEDGLALFRRWLDDGHHLAATAGTDSHHRDVRERGNGFNTVFAEALSEAAVYSAIRAGRNVLSSGPTLRLTVAAADGSTAGPGDTLSARPNRAAVTVAADTVHALVLVTAGGGRREVGPVAGATTRDVALEADAPGWVMAELRAADCALAAVTNPIWWP
jgi:hypothetical protein